ncbi:MAG: hypothetical protein WBV39_10410 [Rudaea sp.]
MSSQSVALFQASAAVVQGRSGRCLVAVFVAMALLSTGSADATDTYWNIAGPGDWLTAGNWDTGNAPTAADNAFIANAGTAQIQTTGAVADQVNVYSGVLDLLAGGGLDSGNGSIGAGAGADGSVLVDGGATWNLGELCVGTDNGSGDLHITNGTVVADDYDYAHAIGQSIYSLCTGSGTATLTLDGPNARLAPIGGVGIGGTVQILNGAQLDISEGDVYFMSLGRLTVDGPGSVLRSVHGDMTHYLGGALITFPDRTNEDPTITVSNGGRIELVTFGGDFNTSAPGIFFLGDDQVASAYTMINIGSGGAPGVLDISAIQTDGIGPYSFIVFDHDASDYHFTRTGTAAGDPISIVATVYNHSVLVYNTGPGTTVLSGPVTTNGGQLRIQQGRIVLDGNTFQGSTGMLVGSLPLHAGEVLQGEVDMIDGATADFSGIDVGTATTPAGPAVLKVDGAGTRLSANAAGELRISPSATVTVSNGAELDASSASAIISGGAHLNIGAPSGETPVAPGRIQTHFLNQYVSTSANGVIVINHDASGYVLSDSARVLTIDAGYRIEHENGDTLIATPNTYDLGTDISGGTLHVVDVGSGSALGSGDVVIDAGATLAGYGNVPAVQVLSGGTLAPRNSAFVPGTLFGSSVTWNGGGAMAVRIGSSSAGSDMLMLSAALSKGSGANFVFHFGQGDGLPTPTTTYTLIQAASTNFDPADFSFDTVPPLTSLTGSFAIDNGAVQFTVTSATSDRIFGNGID